MLITIVKVNWRNYINVPGYGTFDFGKQGENVMEVDDIDGASLVRNMSHRFRKLNMPPIKVERKTRSINPVREPEPTTDEQIDGVPDPKEMTKKEIRAYAEERGVELGLADIDNKNAHIAAFNAAFPAEG